MIERLRPPERESSFSSTAWRPYLLLCGRFVNGDSHASLPDSRLVGDRCAAPHIGAPLSGFEAIHHAVPALHLIKPPTQADTGRVERTWRSLVAHIVTSDLLSPF